MKKLGVALAIIFSVCLLFSCGIRHGHDYDSIETNTATIQRPSSTTSSSNTSTNTSTNTTTNIGTSTSTNSDTPPVEPVYYTITFDANGGEGLEYNEITVAEGSLLDKPYITMPGYKFEAWLTDTGAEYDFSRPVSSSLSLRASWSPAMNTVYFDTNGASGEVEPIEALTESQIALPTPSLEKYGYFFQGWSLDPNGTFESRIVGDYTVLPEGNTLYAIWAENVCYIRYHRANTTVLHVPFTYKDLPFSVEKSPSSDIGYCEGWFDIYGNEVTEITELKEYVLHERWVGVQKIGSAIYSVDNVFETLTLPETIFEDKVLYIKKGAFKNCDKLKTLVLPDTVVNIEEGAFEGCTSLESITLPNNVTIGVGLFKNCSSLKEISLPDCITSIPLHTFDGCSSLESISVGKSFDRIPLSCFSGCKKLNSINVDPENPKFKTVNGNLLSPNETTLFFVAPAKSTIEDAIPSTVSTIESDAFGEIEVLDHMVIPDHVLYIKRDAFSGAKSIRTLDTGKVRSIPEYCFSHMPSLVTLKINDETESCADYAFYKCESLCSVTLSGKFTSFSSKAFDGCNKIFEVFDFTYDTDKTFGQLYVNCLTSSLVPAESAVEIEGDFVFFTHSYFGLYLVSYIGNDSNVVIPDKVAEKYTITDYAFNKKINLTEVTIPDSVTAIEDFAFNMCSNLQKANIGVGVSKMSGASFHLSKKYFTIELDEENQSYIKEGNIIYTADKTTLVRYIDSTDYVFTYVVPEGVTVISNGAFEETNLYAIILPSTLTSIGDYAFCKSPVTEYFIPSSVSYIGLNAFYGPSLSKITFETLSEWRVVNGWFSPDALSDPEKNAEFFAEFETSWRRAD